MFTTDVKMLVYCALIFFMCKIYETYQQVQDCCCGKNILNIISRFSHDVTCTLYKGEGEHKQVKNPFKTDVYIFNPV